MSAWDDNCLKSYLCANNVSVDFRDLIVGDELGRGTSRAVYTHRLDSSAIIKFEYTNRTFQNVHEMHVWETVKGTEYEKWFAPCLHISNSGHILIQKKTSIPEPKEYPEKIPNFLTDIGRRNFGMFEGRFVAHDYGFSRLLHVGLTKRMQKADWAWD